MSETDLDSGRGTGTAAARRIDARSGAAPRHSYSAHTLPDLVDELRIGPADAARLGIAGPASNGELLAAHWHEPRAHACRLDDPHRLTLVLFVAASRVTFDVGGRERTRTAASGRVSVLPPGVHGDWHCAGPAEYLQVCFPAPLTTDASAAPVDRACLADDRTLFQIGLGLVELARSSQQLTASEAAGWATVLSGHLARRYGDPDRAPALGDHSRLSAGRIRGIVEYIDANLQEALNVAELAAAADMSRSKFVYMFKRSTGMSPHRFVVARRLRRARELLGSSGLALSDVADRVGFSSQSHMTSTFRRLTGVTPRAYRDRALHGSD